MIPGGVNIILSAIELRLTNLGYIAIEFNPGILGLWPAKYQPTSVAKFGGMYKDFNHVLLWHLWSPLSSLK